MFWSGWLCFRWQQQIVATDSLHCILYPIREKYQSNKINLCLISVYSFICSEGQQYTEFGSRALTGKHSVLDLKCEDTTAVQLEKKGFGTRNTSFWQSMVLRGLVSPCDFCYTHRRLKVAFMSLSVFLAHWLTANQTNTQTTKIIKWLRNQWL